MAPKSIGTKANVFILSKCLHEVCKLEQYIIRPFQNLSNHVQPRLNNNELKSHDPCLGKYLKPSEIEYIYIYIYIYILYRNKCMIPYYSTCTIYYILYVIYYILYTICTVLLAGFILCKTRSLSVWFLYSSCNFASVEFSLHFGTWTWTYFRTLPLKYTVVILGRNSAQKNKKRRCNRNENKHETHAEHRLHIVTTNTRTGWLPSIYWIASN